MVFIQMLRARAFNASNTYLIVQRSFSNNVKQPLRKISANYHFKKQRNEIPSYFWIPFGGCTATVGIAYYAYIDVVPITGRKRWIATSPNWERQMGDQEFRNLMEQYRTDILPPTHRASATVHRVGDRIASTSMEFAKRYNFASNAALTKNIEMPYTYTVVRSEMANAFVLPGNHVFVFTGLFQYVQNEDELAIILGHEVAHNLARHVGEKLSGSVVLSLIARLSLLFDSSGIVMTILVPSMALIRELPNSRTLEIEADHIGMLLAAEACYDPRAATRVFAAMKNGEKNTAQTPEFLSTHPSHDTRMEKFDEWTPQALERFNAADRCGAVREQMRRARQNAANTVSQRGV